ncbi:MAG: cupin domain-containing protein [Bacteroidales bacterium]|nr:cupin domain-containing protein [Bacteroidales bacterium]
MNSAEEIIKILDLKTHPEGGFYKETYRSHGD